MNIYFNRISAFLFGSALVFGGILNAQSNKCASHSNWVKYAEEHPEAIQRKQELNEFTSTYHRNFGSTSRAAKISIPVVVHVLYNNASQNISDAQVQSQIDVLNEDFRLLNSDSLPDTHPFWPYTIDTEIEFCLAKRDPNGVITTGINRVETNKPYFDFDQEGYLMKSTADGGVDNWDPTRYLNLWVCAFHPDSTTLGFATFPSELASESEMDGVVIRHECFGTTGTAGSNGFNGNRYGRTATHEVGHWLNLYHIWGDEECGDDEVSDTPPQEGDNGWSNGGDCPSFPYNDYNACGTDENGEMFMNYMDYVNDDCMNMFTYGQAERMWAAIDGARSGLKTSNGCEPGFPQGISSLDAGILKVYPNPTEGSAELIIEGISDPRANIRIFAITGEQVFDQVIATTGSQIKLGMEDLNAGVYMIHISFGTQVETQRLIVK